MGFVFCFYLLVCFDFGFGVLEYMQFLSMTFMGDYVISQCQRLSTLQELPACFPLAFSTLPRLNPILHIPRTDRQVGESSVSPYVKWEEWWGGLEAPGSPHPASFSTTTTLLGSLGTMAFDFLCYEEALSFPRAAWPGPEVHKERTPQSL